MYTSPGAIAMSAHTLVGHVIARPQSPRAQVEGAQLRRRLEAEIDGAGPENIATRIDHDSGGADIDIVGHEDLRLG